MNFFKHFKIAFLLSLLLFFVMTLISYLLGNSVSFNYRYLIKLAYYVFYGVSLYMVNMLVLTYYMKKYGENNYPKSRVIYNFLASLIVSMITIFLLRIIEEVVIEGGTLQGFFRHETFANYLIPFVITLVVLLAFNFFYLYKHYKEREVKEQKIIAGTASAKFESLKNQLDPHFLFNSLNVLSSLIEEDQDKAQDFTASLSKVYRYVLEQKDKDLVSVAEEIEFAKVYVSLLKMRFEEAIELQLPKVLDYPEAKIVPLSLQILLENCIKHNVVSNEQPLKIKIEENDRQLIVSNNYQPKKTISTREGVGLNNIKERYKILSTRKLLIHQNQEEFIVRLPLLTKKSSIMDRTENSKTDQYLRARKRVDALKDLYGSLIAYIIVMPVLIYINLNTYSGVKWFWFPMIGWGIGLAFQAYEVYGKDRYFGKAWEERKIKEFMKEEDPSSRWE